MTDALPRFSDTDILTARGPKNVVDPIKPYALLVEPECNADGAIEDVATIFLTNRECPFRCLMCDLWQNTTDQRVPVGSIPAQIDYAFEQLPRLQSARHIKLYNSGNFFDAQAIPPEDLPAIVERVRGYKTVIVENHPKLCGPKCVEFRDALGTQVEIAVGLETAHPKVLPRLNKQMTPDDFKRAVEFLVSNHIRVRTFILLRPPFLSEDEGLEWAIRSTEFAFDCGVSCCAIIPTRAGNGMMERLQGEGHFSPPEFSSLEATMKAGLAMNRGRVFADLWDAERFLPCDDCRPDRIERMNQMNLTQQLLPTIKCHCS